MKTIFEPFKIKMVEPLSLPSAEERRAAIRAAHFNPFLLPARAVTFDLLTDSGTSAMSAGQWAAMIQGDEAYAGSDSFHRFAAVVRELTGLEHVIPTHQGRSAEALLCQAMLKPGRKVPGNTMFDTTRANIEAAGGIALDLPCVESRATQSDFPFKGNADLGALRALLEASAGEVAFFVMTVTNNSIGGQPVALGHVKAAKKLLQDYGVPLFIDAARFAENAYFIKLREQGQGGRRVEEIARELFSLADGVLMSAKKDAFANIGGFLAVRDGALAEDLRRRMVITEGFPTYGGLAGRDLDAIAVGLREILSEDYLAYRLRSVEYFGRGLEEAGFAVVKPFGGHAVYVDAKASVPHVPVKHYPAQALSVAFYEEMGVRGVEVGSVMFGSRDEATGEERFAPRELVRLALPRRVYTQSHVDYMIECAAELFPRVERLPGYRITEQARFLRHFTAKFAPVTKEELP